MSRGSVGQQIAVHAARVVKEVGADDGVELVTAEQAQARLSSNSASA